MPQVYLVKSKVRENLNLPEGTESLVEDQGKEIWVPVKGYEEYYSVSNYGKVRREKTYKGCKAGHVLCPRLTTRGYFNVQLFVNNKGKNRFIHQLVLESFIEERPEGKETNQRSSWGTVSTPLPPLTPKRATPSLSAH